MIWFNQDRPISDGSKSDKLKKEIAEPKERKVIQMRLLSADMQRRTVPSARPHRIKNITIA